MELMTMYQRVKAEPAELKQKLIDGLLENISLQAEIGKLRAQKLREGDKFLCRILKWDGCKK